MEFSSLIFLVIIAVWAAYLVQHWIRRRDHVATARSVDRFSTAMRVLERRGAVAPVKVATPAAHTPVAARPAHPEVVVKRSHSGRTAALAAGARAGAKAGAAGAMAGAARISKVRPPRVSVPRVNPVRMRGLQLLVGLWFLVVGVSLWAAGILPWWAAVAGGLAFVASIATVRFSVLRQQRARRTARRGARTTSQSESQPLPSRAPVAERPGLRSVPNAAEGQLDPMQAPRQARARRRVTSAPVAAARVRGSAPLYVPPVPVAVEESGSEALDAVAVAAEPAASRTALYDVQAVESQSTPAAASQPAATSAQVEAAEGTWAPVPVPPPTYTLKAKATRSRPAAASTPVQELPFDGHALALDEEFEDLPAVRLG